MPIFRISVATCRRPTDDALQTQHVAQHPATQKRPLQVQLIDAAHQLQIRFTRPHGLVIQRGARQLQQLGLTGQTQFVIGIDHRLALDPGTRPSAPAKKSFSSASCPIFACRDLISGPGSVVRPSTIEHIRSSLEQLGLSIERNLIRMNIEPRGQLRQGLFALDRSQCHFGLKCRRMIAAGSFRHGSPSFQAISSLVMDGVATYFPLSQEAGPALAMLG
jgi:hypothetical protein